MNKRSGDIENLFQNQGIDTPYTEFGRIRAKTSTPAAKVADKAIADAPDKTRSKVSALSAVTPRSEHRLAPHIPKRERTDAKDDTSAPSRGAFPTGAPLAPPHTTPDATLHRRTALSTVFRHLKGYDSVRGGPEGVVAGPATDPTELRHAPLGKLFSSLQKQGD